MDDIWDKLEILVVNKTMEAIRGKDLDRIATLTRVLEVVETHNRNITNAMRRQLDGN